MKRRPRRAATNVCEERAPQIGLKPEGVATHPHARKAARQSAVELRVPAAGDALRIELVALQIPFIARQQFDSVRFVVAVETGNGAAQALDRFMPIDRVGERPNAELSIFDTGAEIAGMHLDKILRRLVKKANMRAPGQIAYGVYTCSAKRLLGHCPTRSCCRSRDGKPPLFSLAGKQLSRKARDAATTIVNLRAPLSHSYYYEWPWRAHRGYFHAGP